MVINLEIQKSEQNQQLQENVPTANASDLVSPKPGKVGQGLNMEDEGDVVYETAPDTEQNNNENGRNDGFESRQARKRRKSKRRQQLSDPREAHENLSQLSNSIDKQHFSHIEGNVGRYDSLITAKRLKMHNSRQL